MTDDLGINGIVHAELSVTFPSIEGLEAFLTLLQVTVAEIPRGALFLAGKVFHSYRRRGGTKQSVLPDFLIGAHAAVAGCMLVTRDVGRYRTWFPSVALITPDR